MTEPSQYFKGRTVQEQMNEVIGYVDVRAEEVAAAKADDVLEPAEQAKTDAIAAKEAAEQARDTTLAALPAIQQDIADLKAEDVSLDGRLDTVELKVQTAEGNIVTIQGRITSVENKNTQQDNAITALQTADGQNVKIDNINQYAVGLTGNQNVSGNKNMTVGMQIATILAANAQSYTWYKVAKLEPTKYFRLTYNISLPYNSTSYLIMDAVILTQRATDANKTVAAVMNKIRNTLTDTEYIGVSFDGNNFYLYIKTGSATHSCLYATAATAAGSLVNSMSAITPIEPVIEDPTTNTNYVII